ncbi:hypothetical protein DPMN_181583 [Dreissena polymorpha]|uniref:Uncharacterized protein n=1 Tax=Dreissena polymorpha TaxID=45954 RepID=A0A9D4I5F9_DREPO|nr:hypothetical protein DPMN_181583 [Dreissena polymorpha]
MSTHLFLNPVSHLGSLFLHALHNLQPECSHFLCLSWSGLLHDGSADMRHTSLAVLKHVRALTSNQHWRLVYGLVVH